MRTVAEHLGGHARVALQSGMMAHCFHEPSNRSQKVILKDFIKDD